MYADNSVALHEARPPPLAVGELLNALASTLNDESDSAERRLSRLAALLRKAEAPPTPSVPPKGGLAPWQVRVVVSHVERNLDKSIKSSELATIVRLNPCYFSRVFRGSFGETPLGYVTRQRVERAQRLMLSTGTSLSQIAFDCGFADQAHFSRLFRRMTGDTPRAWRRARMSPLAVRAAAGA